MSFYRSIQRATLAVALLAAAPVVAQETRTELGQLASLGQPVDMARTGKEPEPKKVEGKIRIGFSPTAMNTHYDVVIAGARQAIRELGDDKFELVIQAPSGQSGIAEQMNIVETWVNQGYDAIALATANDQAMMPIYEKAAAAGIPIFLFNMPVTDSDNPYYVSNVGYDQFEAGRLMGLYTVEQYGEKPTKLAIIEGLPGVHNTQRLSGFMSGLGDNANITIVASQPGDWVRDRAQSVMENILTANPDGVDVVWGLYDEMALGALAAIRGRGLEDKIDVLGYDNTPDANEAIKRGEMTATVDTAPKEMGYNLVVAIETYVGKGEMLPKVINSEVVVWDQATIANFDPANYVFVEK